MRSRFAKGAVALTGVLLCVSGCGAREATPSPIVTVAETVTVPVTISPSPVYGLMDPDVEKVLIEVCRHVADNEPSWNSMIEYGPYDDVPIQADMVALAGRNAREAYQWALDRLDYLNQAHRGNTLYGSVYTDLSNRANLAMAMTGSADSYLKDGSDYHGLYYFWAAYTASIEGTVSGCADYLG